MKPHPKPILVALDLDGTLKPKNGQVGERVTHLISTLKKRGVLFALVTGRCLDEIHRLVDTNLFDVLVAENGSIIVEDGSKRVLAPGWWLEKRRTLAQVVHGCEEVIISLDAQQHSLAVSLAQAMGGAVERNKDRVMVLPPQTNKATGLAAALHDLRVDPRRVVCAGDGENDLPLFRLCGVKVALKNSVQQLKEIADYVATKEDGEGVVEVLSQIFGVKA